MESKAVGTVTRTLKGGGCGCRSTGECPGYGTSSVCPPLIVVAVMVSVQAGMGVRS